MRAEDQPLFQGLRRALRSEPTDFLTTVGGLLEATDSSRKGPFASASTGPTVAELVESFIGTPFAETTAALTVIKALVPDEVLAARIGRELATRRHPLPEWLVGLDRARIDNDVWLMTHVLGDGDDYLLGATLASGVSVSALVYIDHNMGHVVKDAFVIPEPMQELQSRMQELIEDPDQILRTADPATARAVIVDAIRQGEIMWPPLESESWPVCRPVISWMVRMLPEGGAPPSAKEWSKEERAQLAGTFLASRFGADLDHPDRRALLTDLLWFGADYGQADPLSWSPVRVEMLLADWFPRKIVAETAVLAKLPDLLRAFIRYAHHERNIRTGLTDETLAAVDAWEPEYQRLIRTSRPQGAQALAASLLGAIGHDSVGDEDLDDIGVPEILLEGLDRAVGDRYRLMNLDDAPLPDEPFEWSGIPDDIRPVVQEMLDGCDRCADELLDVELRTAMRRFLSRAAAGDPAPFRRKASPIRGAAAVAWVVCRANDAVDLYGEFQVKELLGWFGQKGSVSQRAEPLLRANGVDPRTLYGSMDLGAPDLLTGQKRARIIEARDLFLAQARADDQSE